MYIDEIKRELTGRLLAIWTGKNEDGSPIDLPQDKIEGYRKMWRASAKPQADRGLLRPKQAQRKPCNCGGKRPPQSKAKFR